MGGGSSHVGHESLSQKSATNSPKLGAKSPRRLKFSFKRKTSERDQIRPFEELIRYWPSSDIDLLLAEFEADLKLLELQNQCDSTRKAAKSIAKDLEVAAKFEDLNLIFKTRSISCNRRFLLQRCKNLKIPEELSIFSLDEIGKFQKLQPEDVENFLKFQIYTEKFGNSRISEEFGCQKRLEEDLREMQKLDLKNGDLVIQVVEGKSPNSDTFSIRCSSLVAAARSPIIRSLLLRKSVQKEKEKTIVFSDLIFPKVFAPLFVLFLYTDRLDWSLAPKSDDSISSLSLAKAITTNGKSPDLQLARALKIIEIARFFEVEKLVQACEDVVIRNLSPDNVVQILQWGRTNNSKYISTHAFRFIEREFSRIATSSSSSPNFLELSSQEMEELTKSQFCQCTELEMLNACCRWGEFALLRKLEEREPNLVADTCHSISRRGLKKSEKSGEELKEILKPLAENIRKDYALPPFHQDLTDAYNKGILEQSPMGQDLVVCASTSEINPDAHWLKPEQSSAGPRYYRSYHTTLIKHRTLKDPSWTPPTTSSESEDVFVAPEIHLEFQNIYPDILEDSLFIEARNRIEKRAKLANLANFGRVFHRKMALEMITRQTLIEMNIAEECISCRFSSENLENSGIPTPPPDVVLPGSCDIF
ncbi:hypothetical protein L5515_006883 [Caenorhabditis briggsae]|uniref:BACK domain-containing protein n=2 Tax=Caenorhabditis briggsae TaxID=6238 RepID=A0AAE9F2M3_CAEBR|nr:hypothetical protein L5515_006883 [Caenorhabditis briggsae]